MNYTAMDNNNMVDAMEFQEGVVYSERVKNAVRYGYQYRKEAEKHKKSDVKFCLGDPSEILYWIANMIIGGLAWDLIKKSVKKAYEWVLKHGINTDHETNKILTDEIQLRQFYVYIKEFDEHRMSVDKRTLKYIKEEIIADYAGESIGEIISKENRIPETEEYVRILRETLVYADSLLNDELNTKDQQDRSKQDS